MNYNGINVIVACKYFWVKLMIVLLRLILNSCTMKMRCVTPSFFIWGTDKKPAKLVFSVVMAGVVCCVSRLMTWKN